MESENSSLDTVPRTSRHFLATGGPPSRHDFINVKCGGCGHDFIFELDCGDRTCGHCQNRRKKRVYRRYQSIVVGMDQPKFLTLTVRRRVLNSRSIQSLRGFFTKLRHRKAWRARGGLYQIEVGSIDDLNMCNMHIHAIIDSPVMSQKDLSDAWRDITHGSYIVDIRMAFGARGCLKYLTKHMGKRIGDSRHKDLINSALKGTRLVQGFGYVNREGFCMSSAVCPKCGAIGTLVSKFDNLYVDVLDAF